jgi:hypothetical protein
MKALGLNTVTAYVAWNYHEDVYGTIRGLDAVTSFLQLAKEVGMLVLLRPGPYICAEWEFGGLPSSLLQPDIKLRTFDEKYIAAVDRWWGALLPEVRPYLYSKGGPIVMMQIENEYGYHGDCASNPDDAKYMNHLLELATKFLGTDVVYITIDLGQGDGSILPKGSPWHGDSRVVATVDGGLSSSYSSGFQQQKEFNAPGNSPKMWTELWSGWFTKWGEEHATNRSTKEFYEGVWAMVNEGASFSLYMAHGGTNFGFWSGASLDKNSEGKLIYRPDITSYDYSAPISEAGDHNVGSDGGDLFDAVRGAIASVHGEPELQEPAPKTKTAYGEVLLQESASLFDNIQRLATCNVEVAAGDALPSMEKLMQHYGLVLYRSSGSFDAATLPFESDTLHDRVQVFVDGSEVGTAYRADCPTTVDVPAGQSMHLLVENMGRLNFGHGIDDYKGLLSEPPVSGNWSATCLPLVPVQVMSLPYKKQEVSGPAFKRGWLSIWEEPADTFLDSAGFTKGYVWVNGYELGRYWETAGPQHTVYLPGAYLHEGLNEIVVLDLHGSDAVSITSVASPRYGGVVDRPESIMVV